MVPVVGLSAQIVLCLHSVLRARTAFAPRPGKTLHRTVLFPPASSPVRHNQTQRHPLGASVFGAGGGTRTHTESPPADFESATSTIPSHRHVTRLLYRIFFPNARQKLRPRRGRNLVFQNGLTASPTGRAALHGGRPDYQRAHSCRRSTAWCRRTGCIRRSCHR